MHAKARQRGARRWLILMISLLVTLCVAIGIAIALTPMVVRHVFISRLADADKDVRMSGMVYVCRHAASDPKVFEDVAQLLADETTDARTADAIVRALRCAKVWGPAVGQGWVRYLNARVDHGDASLRLTVALELAQAGLDGAPVAATRPMHDLVMRLVDDADADVRYAALKAAATLPIARAAAEKRIDDEHETIARLASIITALDSGQPVPPPVAGAGDVKVWRAALDPSTPVEQLIAIYQSPPAGDNADAIAAAAASRLAPRWADDPAVATALGAVGWSGDESKFFRELAVLEHLPTGSIDLPFTSDMPDLVRAAAARVAKAVSDDDWLNAFDSPHAGVRHLAAMAAIERLAPAKLQQFARRLSRTFYDNERMGGAMLAGLAGGDPKLLRDRMNRESVWVVQQHVRLALHMLGEPMDIDFDALLVRSDMPRQSVIAAMLHTGSVGGFDKLFRPLAGDGGSLRDELDRQRFWPMIGRYLPVDAPPFDVWADPAMQQHQCDVLRTWYLMNRNRLVFESEKKRFTTEGHGGPRR